MGRNREFDADHALDAAMHTFWERGYDGTSLSDLTEATGVGRQSLYLAFGDKQKLYLAALDRYREHFFVPLVEALDTSTDVRTALRDAILPLIDGSCVDQPEGCLLVAAATERATEDAAVRTRVTAAFAGLETALLEAAQRSRAAGRVSDTVDLTGWAAMAVAVIQGLRVLAAGGTDRGTLIRGLEATLAQLHP
ncbi:TetR/AcrR family transcriptional regulator, transcriptional repressor for nem operon [Asanoa hainanensis]|uniref:TetR/AcrR family transcriptional regulator, transcriptional repressor for nem operon n=1 Tax=Asanoa hainanensis TaxID=560556 RepID=A0A239N1E7_9ACTN|nr:TetR/AcrR family transcriptional regulator [Asanoa hainanensis]SNT48008.1 TetR/AcrR family transcriptional regulator, transcriptional repressor for nem operon [Asanoa hainanensis]